MMAYLTRPGFNGGGAVSNRTVLPKRKPAAEVKKRKRINYEKIKQYLGKESQELIERELGFADGGRIGFLRGGEVKFRKGAYTVSGKLYPGKSFTYDYKGEKGKVFEGPPEGSKKKFNAFELRFKTKAEAQAALDSINQQRTGGKNLTAKKFAELRTNDINKFLTTDEFAQKLNRYGYRNMKGELFTGLQVKDRQEGLDVPGREKGTLKPGEKPVTPAVQKKLKANFPEVEFNFKKYKYGTLQRIVGKDTYMAIFHNSIDSSKRWPIGANPKDKLWYNAYRSALQGERYKILTQEGNPLTLDEIKNANFSKNSKAQTFLDTKTGKTFTYDTFENWINNDSVQGMPDANRYNK